MHTPRMAATLWCPAPIDTLTKTIGQLLVSKRFSRNLSPTIPDEYLPWVFSVHVHLHCRTGPATLFSYSYQHHSFRSPCERVIFWTLSVIRKVYTYGQSHKSLTFSIPVTLPDLSPITLIATDYRSIGHFDVDNNALRPNGQAFSQFAFSRAGHARGCQ